MTWQLAVEAMRIGIAGTPLGGAVVSAQARNLAGQLDQWADRIRTAKPHQVGDLVREALRMTDTMTRQLEAMPPAEREYLASRIHALRTAAHNREAQVRAATTADHVAPPAPASSRPAGAPPMRRAETAETRMIAELRHHLAESRAFGGAPSDVVSRAIDGFMQGRRDLDALRGLTIGELRRIVADAGVASEWRDEAVSACLQTIARVVHDRVVARAAEGTSTMLDTLETSSCSPVEVERLARILCGERGAGASPRQAVALAGMFDRLGGEELRSLRRELSITQDTARRAELREQIRSALPAAIGRVVEEIRSVTRQIRDDLATDNRHLGALRMFRRVTQDVLRESGVRDPNAALEGRREGTSVAGHAVGHFIREHDDAQRVNEITGAVVLTIGSILTGNVLGGAGLVGVLMQTAIGMAPDALQVAVARERVQTAQTHAALGLQTEGAVHEAEEQLATAVQDAATNALTGQVNGALGEYQEGIGLMGDALGPLGEIQRETDLRRDRDLQDEVARQRTQRPRI